MLFSKPKDPRAATPRTCERCRERPGNVRLPSLEAPRSRTASTQDAPDWWLCSDCARLVGRDEPEGS